MLKNAFSNSQNANKTLILLSSGYYVNMTSQRWLTDADFTDDSQAKSVWWHILIVIVPDELKFRQNATLYITGRGMTVIKFNDSDDITGATYLACASKSIVGVLFQVQSKIYLGTPVWESLSKGHLGK